MTDDAMCKALLALAEKLEESDAEGSDLLADAVERIDELDREVFDLNDEFDRRRLSSNALDAIDLAGRLADHGYSFDDLQSEFWRAGVITAGEDLADAIVACLGIVARGEQRGAA